MSSIKDVPRLFLTKHQTQSSHYKNGSKDTLGIGSGSRGMHGAYYGNHSSDEQL
jgi:hypothetical protein